MKGGWMVVNTRETVESKQSRYLRLMRKAQQLDDQLLVRLILRKLAHLDKTGSRLTTGRRVIIPFPSIRASAEKNDYGPLESESSDFSRSKGRSKIDMKLISFYCIAVIVLVFMFFKWIMIKSL